MKNNHIQITIFILLILFIITQIISLIYKKQIKYETQSLLLHNVIKGQKADNYVCCEKNLLQKSYVNDPMDIKTRLVKVLNALQVFIKKDDIGKNKPLFASENAKKNSIINQSKIDIKKNMAFFYYSGRRFIDLLNLNKNLFLEVSKKYMTKNHFDLVSGMLFGDISSMESSFKHKLKVIGMLHVVSASGYNISLLLMIIGTPFKSRVSRKQWVVVAILCIFIYLILAGAQPSIIRASIMSSISIFVSNILRRQYRPARVLFLTAILMIFINKAFLESISFQLSFFATMGIILFLSRGKIEKNRNISIMFGEILTESGSPGKDIGTSAVFSIFKDSFKVTLAAQLLVWPLLLFHFGEFNVISLVVNTFLLWLTPLITIFGLLFVSLAWFFNTFFNENGQIIIQVMYIFLWCLIGFFEYMVGFFSKFEWMNFATDQKPPITLAFLWWGLVFSFLKIKKIVSGLYEKSIY